MKKIFTLLFAVGMVTFASAQSNTFYHGKPGNGYALNKRQPVVYATQHGCDVIAEKFNSHINSWQRNEQFREHERKHREEFSQQQFHQSKDNHGFSNHDYAYNKKQRW